MKDDHLYCLDETRASSRVVLAEDYDSFYKLGRERLRHLREIMNVSSNILYA